MKSFPLVVCFLFFISCSTNPEPLEISYKLDSTIPTKQTKLTVKRNDVVKVIVTSNSLCPSEKGVMNIQLNSQTIGSYIFEKAPATDTLRYDITESGELIINTAIQSKNNGIDCVWLGELFFSISY